MQHTLIHKLVMVDPPISLAVLSQPLGPGGQTISALSSSALPECGKTHLIKFDPELRVYHLEWSSFVHNIHLIGGTQGVHAQGS
jgi:hypothetical protein